MSMVCDQGNTSDTRNFPIQNSTTRKEREPLDIQWLSFRLPCLQQIRYLFTQETRPRWTTRLIREDPLNPRHPRSIFYWNELANSIRNVPPVMHSQIMEMLCWTPITLKNTCRKWHKEVSFPNNLRSKVNTPRIRFYSMHIIQG